MLETHNDSLYQNDKCEFKEQEKNKKLLGFLNKPTAQTIIKTEFEKLNCKNNNTLKLAEKNQKHTQTKIFKMINFNIATYNDN
jgi:hypothetical protein